MANGALVVTSNVSSLPEVGGDVAFYFDNVLDEKELARTIMETICLDKEKKQEIIKNGLKQVEKFDWNKCAEETITVIKRSKT
jgi:glycosyltransferase involved in cell wall biosynthesis